jgi:2-haloacid dehalogenase
VPESSSIGLTVNGRADNPVDAVVFDVGGVLIDWDPRHLYRKIFDDAAQMERFLAEVCTTAWNEQADAGRPIAEITAELCRDHPDQRPLIENFYARFPEMMKDALRDTVILLDRLHAEGVPLYVLSNFSAETFPHARQRFTFFERFTGMVISGAEGMKKPDPRIFELLTGRFALNPARTLFIDDRQDNVAAARDAGWQSVLFTSAEQLAIDLDALGLLPQVSASH